MWTARRILKDLADADLRKRVLTAFWRYAEPSSRLLAAHHLAQAMRFRDETIKKMAPEKKAELLASRIGAPEFDQFLEMGLMQYHTHEKSDLLAAFLDRWGVPHEEGSIEAEEYERPKVDAVRAAVNELESQFRREDIVLYLAAAGLLMDDDWRAATWPVVDEMSASAPRPA
jgi:hypothetical protein